MIYKNSLIVTNICLLLLLSILQFGDAIPRYLFLFEVTILLLLLTFFLNRKTPKKLGIICILFFPVLVSSFISSFIQSDLVNFITMSVYGLGILSCCSLGANLNKENFLTIINLYAYCSLFLHIFGFLRGNIFSYSFGYYGFSGLFSNPNYYGLFSAVSLLFIIVGLSSSGQKLLARHYLILIINIIGLIIAQSRGALLSFVLGMLSYYTLANYKVFRLKINIRNLLTILMIVAIAILLYISGSLDVFINKTKHLDSDLSNGRFDLWRSAWDSMRFWTSRNENLVHSGLGTHNNYLNIGVLFGIATMLSFIAFWFGILLYLTMSFFKSKSIQVLVPISLLIFGMSYWLFEVGSSFVYVWMISITFGYSCFNISNQKLNTIHDS